MLGEFYKNNASDQVWWVDDIGTTGNFLFSFDKKKVYNLFRDYEKLTPKEKAIFDKENPYWAEFFNEP